jgi:hypothetical protein
VAAAREFPIRALSGRAPCLVAAFDTTKRVVTHHLRITDASQLHDSIAALLAEAYADVGPGTRDR